MTNKTIKLLFIPFFSICLIYGKQSSEMKENTTKREPFKIGNYSQPAIVCDAEDGKTVKLVTKHFSKDIKRVAG